MNKKLMAVAVAGALGTIGAPALAQFSTATGLAPGSTGSSVTISGKMNFLYGHLSSGDAGNTITGGAPAATSSNSKLSYDDFQNSESQINVQGVEDLGGGMAAWFQCGSTLDVTGTASAQGTAGLCGRNSAIGMRGNWGNAYGGNWDTSAKMAMTPFSVWPQANPLGNGIMYNNISTTDAGTKNGVSTASAFGQSGGNANFWRRQSRILNYITPEWKGFQASAGYSASNESSGASVGSGVQKPRLYSIGGTYNNGPMKFVVAYEVHKDFNPAGLAYKNSGNGAGATNGVSGNYAGGTDTGLMLGAGYKFLNDAVVVNAQFARLSYQVLGDQTTTQSNWNLNGQWNIAGPHSIKLGYVDMGSTHGTYGAGLNQGGCLAGSGTVAGNGACASMVGAITANGGAGNTGAKKYQFEYAYAFSKRTDIGLGYSKMNNDAQSNQNIGTGSTAAGFGQSQSYYGLRMSHSF